MSKNYISYLEPRRFSNIEEDIISATQCYCQGEPYKKWVRDAATIHSFVSDKSDYHLSGRTVHKPSSMMDGWKISGDCEDQTVLLSSMACSTSTITDIQLIAVNSSFRGDDAHILTMFGIPQNRRDRVVDLIKNFYDEVLNYSIGAICWENYQGRTYFPADATMSNYVAICPANTWPI
ncbi:hypothetical protein [Halogeometricum sp. CBA1124]|uniref:hypothetical protein n=1 Tax=Halogeometricum sp. CBA1124 TaxID=2668071 RepID=UPI00142C30F4|nr:hypothetical protein [Halogeometricum sp. CBA1124]MUV56095.1 hypothetical protein [Halogeometricum sp. CBA1124]